MEYLTCNNFSKIKDFILEEGELIIWSSRYGDGFQYKFGNIDVIYVPSVHVGLPAGSWEDFFYIKVAGKRLSYHIENDGDEIIIEGSIEVFDKKETLKFINEYREEADSVFSKILKYVK